MKTNSVIETLLSHKSIRKYMDKEPNQETIQTIVRAGQQAPFAYQAYSVILSRKRNKIPFNAPLLFTLCVDIHKFELIMKKRNWKRITNDLTLLLFGIEDASYMAQNMVIAGRSLGLGSCFLGRPMTAAAHVAKEFKLPQRVFPIVQLVMGYPAEDPPCRPRYPLEFTLFEDEYPTLDDETVVKAMKQMDEGYLAQDYYLDAKALISLVNREETFSYDDYSWTEHISRKLGQWHDSTKKQLKAIEECGFNIDQD